MEIFTGMVLSSEEGFEWQASDELRDILGGEFGYEDVSVQALYGLTSLSIIKFPLNPDGVLKEIAEKLLEHPYIFNFVLKMVPIRIKMETTLQNLEQAGKNYANRIGDDDRWKIILRRRDSPIGHEEAIESAAKHIDKGEVDLENPDLIFRIEIIDDTTYTSLSKVQEVSVEKLQRERNQQIEDIYA